MNLKQNYSTEKRMTRSISNTDTITFIIAVAHIFHTFKSYNVLLFRQFSKTLHTGLMM